MTREANFSSVRSAATAPLTSTRISQVDTSSFAGPSSSFLMVASFPGGSASSVESSCPASPAPPSFRPRLPERKVMCQVISFLPSAIPGDTGALGPGEGVAALPVVVVLLGRSMLSRARKSEDGQWDEGGVSSALSGSPVA